MKILATALALSIVAVSPAWAKKAGHVDTSSDATNAQPQPAAGQANQPGSANVQPSGHLPAILSQRSAAPAPAVRVGAVRAPAQPVSGNPGARHASAQGLAHGQGLHKTPPGQAKKHGSGTTATTRQTTGTTTSVRTNAGPVGGPATSADATDPSVDVKVRVTKP